MGESDLRALAAEAMRGKTVQTFQDAADAVLAAVLPVHRRQVLAEAVDAIERESFDLKVNDGTAATGGYLRPQTATDAVRRLNATAPADAFTPSQTAQDAPVVPEQAEEPSKPSETATAPLDEPPWLAGGPTAQTPGRHIYRAGHDAPIGSMDTPALAAQVVAEHRHAVQFRALVAVEEPGPTRRPDDAGTLAVRLAGPRNEALPAVATGEFVAVVSRTEWAAILRERTQNAHTIDGLADAALRLSGVRDLAAERARFAVQVVKERDRLQAQLADYERRINWFTTCGNCATLLDSAYDQTMRAEQAEAERDRLLAAVERAQARIEESRRVVPGNGVVE